MQTTWKPNLAFEEVPDAKNSILLIDGLNLFFRSFSAIDTINPKGEHIGGLAGFIQSLAHLIRISSPKSVYIFFDGLNSTETKKLLVKDYKKGRGSGSKFKNSLFQSKQQEEKSKREQLKSLFEYLKVLPVRSIILNGAEADDAISYTASIIKENTVIVSTDKDFLQTCKDNNFVYSPKAKIVFTKQRVFEKFEVLAENFIIYKTLIGDKSDNIPGMQGVGPKKAIKLFPELSEKRISIDDLFKICELNINNNDIYAKIIMQENKIRNQHKIMNLLEPMIHESHKKHLYEILTDNKKSVLNESYLRELIRFDYLYPVLSNVDKTLEAFTNI